MPNNGMIGQVKVGSDNYLIGSTLFASSSSLANAGTKVAVLQSSATYSAATGITIHVKFDNENTETDSTKLKLQVGSDTAKPIVNPNGALTWQAGSVISFTDDGTNWVMNSSAIDGSSIQNLTLGNITNDGKLATANTVVITNANKQIAPGPVMGSTADGSYLDNTGNWTTPPDTKYKLVTAATAAGTANAAGTNGSTYLNLVENNSVLNSHKLSGTNIEITSNSSTGEISFVGKAGTVTSVKIETTSPLTGGNATATTTTGAYTLGLADGYGDTKNPYGTKNANQILAGPESGAAAAPAFRALVDADIPNTIARLNSPALTGTPTAPTAAVGTNSTQIATTAFVASEISDKLAANDAMQFKGTIGSGGNPGTLPTNAYQAGWTYRVIVAGEYAGQNCEVGDLIIAIADGPSTGSSVRNADWTVAQTNIDGALYKGSTYTNGQLLVAGSSGAVNTSGYTLAAPAAGSLIYGSSTTAYGSLAIGTQNQVLTVNNSGMPVWAAAQHYTSHLYVTGQTGTGDTTSALDNGSVYLRLFDDTTVRATHKISGSGATTVITDASANIIIASTDTQYIPSGSENALTSLTLSYNNGTAQSETPTTATPVGVVSGGILYIKSITYDTDAVITGISPVSAG